MRSKVGQIAAVAMIATSVAACNSAPSDQANPNNQAASHHEQQLDSNSVAPGKSEPTSGHNAASPSETEESSTGTVSQQVPENVLRERDKKNGAAQEKVESQGAGSACGVPTAEQAIQTWIGQVSDGPWKPSAEYAETKGYDPCAALSYIVLSIDHGTASSPFFIMLFHHGEYLGTATKKAYGFHPTVRRLDDSAISVTYKWLNPGDINANPTASSEAQFRWDDDAGHVVMTGEVPPEN